MERLAHERPRNIICRLWFHSSLGISVKNEIREVEFFLELIGVVVDCDQKVLTLCLFTSAIFEAPIFMMIGALLVYVGKLESVADSSLASVIVIVKSVVRCLEHQAMESKG